MCFGNTATQKTVTSTANPAVSAAADQNLSFAQNLQNTGFQPYTGQQVASFSPQQSQSFTDASNLSSSVNGGPIGQLTQNYASAPAQSVSANTISSQMSPYMNQYVNMALQPQLQQQAQLNASQNHSFDSAATGSGAFGDSSWQLGRGNLANQQSIAQQGLVGNAYNAAFNTAIGAGAQDVSNNLNAQTTNANLAETALGRQLTGANAMQTQQTGAANLQNTMGGQQTAQSQAGLNAAYNQWQLAQQYPFQTAQLLNQTTSAGAQAMPATQTTSAPDNSGYGLLGSLAGPATSGLSSMFGGAGAAADSGAAAAAGMGTAADSAALLAELGPMAMIADGGAIPGGKPVIVGERGPELFLPGANGVVIPNEVMAAARDKRAQKVGNAPASNSLNFGLAA